MLKGNFISITLVMSFAFFGLVSNLSAQCYEESWYYYYEDWTDFGGADISDLEGTGEKSLVLFQSNGYLIVLDRFPDEEDFGVEKWTLNIGDWGSGAPGTADVDGDGKKEIFVAGETNGFHAYRYNGDLFWRNEDVLMGYDGDINFAPTISDVDGDGSIDIIVSDSAGNITLINASTGETIWQTSTGDDFYGSTAVSDLDGDGSLEIITPLSYSGGMVYVLEGQNGAIRWTSLLASNYYSSPAVADFDGDGSKEIVVVSEEGHIFALEHDGQIKWEYNAGDGYYEEFIYTAPVIGDVDGDQTMEIICVGASTGYLYVLDTQGNIKWKEDSCPSYSGGCSTPSLADVDEDGINEIIVGRYHSGGINIFHADEKTREGIYDGRYFEPQILIDDLDRDGLVELVATDWYSSEAYVIDGCGQLANSWPTFQQNNRRTGAFEAPLLDPVQLLESVAEKVIELDLPKGISNSLGAKLDAALKAIDDLNANNDVAAINSLGAFINAVEAQRGKKIPEVDAVYLIEAAEEIIDLLLGV